MERLYRDGGGYDWIEARDWEEDGGKNGGESGE